MTDQELLNIVTAQRVVVKATDYSYEGWVVTVFPKRRRHQIRCVVEDDNGRLFIHNASQLTVS